MSKNYSGSYGFPSDNKCPKCHDEYLLNTDNDMLEARYYKCPGRNCDFEGRVTVKEDWSRIMLAYNPSGIGLPKNQDGDWNGYCLNPKCKDSKLEYDSGGLDMEEEVYYCNSCDLGYTVQIEVNRNWTTLEKI